MPYLDQLDYKGTLYDLQDSNLKEDLKLKADLPTETIENASIASFTDGAEDVPVKELKVAIEPIQSGSGDPSPTNVRPISGRDSVTVTRTGVNVWDEEWESGQFNWNTGQEVTSSAFIRFKNRTPVKPSTNYAFVKPAGVYARPVYYDINGEFVSGPEVIYTSPAYTEITIPNNVYYVRFAVQVTTYGNNISLNYPSTDHDYHAYEGDSYPISLSSTIYGGTLEVETGVLTVDRALVDLGDFTWNKSGDSPSGGFIGVASPSNPGKALGRSNIISTAYKSNTEEVSIPLLPNGSISGQTNNNNIYVRDDSATSVAELKATLSGVYAVYEVTNPTTVQLTPTQVTTLLKDNNIFADSGDVKKLIYRADLGAYIEKLINA